MCKQIKPLEAFTGGELKGTYSRCRECENKRRSLLAARTRNAVLEHYGAFCACCGEEENRFLTIDHINDDGAVQRREHKIGKSIYKWIVDNNYPDDLRILCFNCNCGRQLNNGVCPHQEKAESVLPVLSELSDLTGLQR